MRQVLDEEEISGWITPDDMVWFSGLSFAAAGACLAIVLLLTQIWTPNPDPLHVWALALAALAMPLFAGVAMFDRIWTSMKLSYQSLHRITGADPVRAGVWYIAAICLLSSINCLVFSLSSLAGGIFTVSVLAAIGGGWWAFQYAFPRAWLAANGQEIPTSGQSKTV